MYFKSVLEWATFEPFSLLREFSLFFFFSWMGSMGTHSLVELALSKT